MTTATTISTLPATDDILAEIVDLERYPLHDPTSAEYHRIVDAARAGLHDVGCARLDAVVRPESHARLAAESRLLEPEVQVTHTEFTPYVSVDDTYPEDHPRRRLQAATNGFVTRDLIPDSLMIQRLYGHPAFIRFVADCFEKPELHQFADPMRGLVVNVMPDDAELPWHFDANEYIVSLMTVEPERGGTFEYCPNIRTPDDERYDAVRAVLDGDDTPVRRLDLRVGDLQLFMGGYSLHRVRPARGGRHTAIFGYSEQPGYIASVDSTQRAYGRHLQAHVDADRARERTSS